jgi:hypothetical protein
MLPETKSTDPAAAKSPEPAAELPWYIAQIKKEKSTMKGAPFSFVICVIICTTLLGIGIFTVDQWHYSGTIAEKEATIEQKDANLGQKDETIRTISEERDSANRNNDKLARDNEWLRNYRSKETMPLKQNAIILARQIHEFIKDWKDTDDPVKKEINVQKYLQRFSLRASIMRDDLDQSGQHSDDFDKVMYNFSYSYGDVRTIADQIEKLANDLPD